MSGVCRNWVRNFQVYHKTDSLSRLHSGSGGSVEQPASAKFSEGRNLSGSRKTVCVPGLNCYSCPAASGACPIGALQTVVGSAKYGFSYYITGILILLGVLLGRFICGFLCPFGWFQELLHKIPTKKFSTKKLKCLTWIKYVVLLVTVFLLPALAVDDVGMGAPFSASIFVRRAYWRSNSAIRCQFRYSICTRSIVCLEIQCFDCGNCGKRAVLQTVLQMAVSAWCVLCPFEQGFAVSNESGYRQMCSLRKMRKSLQNGRGRNEIPEPYRMYSLRYVRPGMSDKRRSFSVRLRRR